MKCVIRARAIVALIIFEWFIDANVSSPERVFHHGAQEIERNKYTKVKNEKRRREKRRT